jgi:hypothetical protein
MSDVSEKTKNICILEVGFDHLNFILKAVKRNVLPSKNSRVLKGPTGQIRSARECYQWIDPKQGHASQWDFIFVNLLLNI